jgi:anti-anti-sigma regulatory factor
MSPRRPSRSPGSFAASDEALVTSLGLDTTAIAPPAFLERIYQAIACNIGTEEGSSGPVCDPGRSPVTDGASESAFAIRLRRGSAVVTVPEALGDWNAQRFWEALALAVTESSLVAVDLSPIRQCDPAALAPLVMALRLTDVTGGEIRVILGMSQHVQSMFAAAGMHRLFRTYDSLSAALQDKLGTGLRGTWSAEAA